jgi:hypothetical protein
MSVATTHLSRSGYKSLFFASPMFCVLVTGGVLLAGCGKKTSTVVEAPPPAALASAPVPASMDQPQNNPNPDSAIALTGSDGQPDLTALNHCLIRWIMGNRRKPTSFADFAATATVAIPQPPPGKKYIIAKNMHIQLVDR